MESPGRRPASLAEMGTIQLDAQMPQRFELRYMGADNQEHFRPFGSERYDGQSTADGSNLQLHVLDRLFSNRNAFDNLLVGINFG